MSSHASSHRRTVEEYGGPARWSVVLLVVLLAAVLVLPWLVPTIPRTLAGLLPDGRDETPATVPEVAPHVEPPSNPFFVSGRPAPTAVALKALPAAGKPRSLRVDRLSVRSKVVPISGESGVLLPPSDATVLGWWREGAAPGAALGTAVMTGHTVSTGGGAFDNLRRLVTGDRVVVRTAKGSIPYVVRSTRIYGTAALARNSREIFRLDGPGRLVLITCSDYNGEIYLTNTVVTAVPVVRSTPVLGGADRAPAR